MRAQMWKQKKRAELTCPWRKVFVVVVGRRFVSRFAVGTILPFVLLVAATRLASLALALGLSRLVPTLLAIDFFPIRSGLLPFSVRATQLAQLALVRVRARVGVLDVRTCSRRRTSGSTRSFARAAGRTRRRRRSRSSASSPLRARTSSCSDRRRRSPSPFASSRRRGRR